MEENTLLNLFADIFNTHRLKVAIFLIVIYFIITSEMFVKDVLSYFDSQKMGEPTLSGRGIQAIFLSIFYILIDLLVKSEII